MQKHRANTKNIKQNLKGHAMTHVKALAKNVQARSVVTAIIALAILVGNVISTITAIK